MFFKAGGVRDKFRLSRYVERFWTKKSFICSSLFRYYIKQIDSLLPCVCSVIDHRRRQNVVRTSVTRLSPRVPLLCSYHILTSAVIYYWTDARQHGIYLYYIITKSLFYFKIFEQNAKAGLFALPLNSLCTKKKPFDVIYDLTKWSNFIGCYA